MSKAVRVVSPGPTRWSGWSDAKSGGLPGLVRVVRVVRADRKVWEELFALLVTQIAATGTSRAVTAQKFSYHPDHPDHPDQPSISAVFQHPLPGPQNYLTRTTSDRCGC